MSLNRVSSNNGDIHLEAGTVTPQLSTISVGVLNEIGRRCGSKVIQVLKSRALVAFAFFFFQLVIPFFCCVG